jgi:hypothetical protein
MEKNGEGFLSEDSSHWCKHQWVVVMMIAVHIHLHLNPKIFFRGLVQEVLLYLVMYKSLLCR